MVIRTLFSTRQAPILLAVVLAMVFTGAAAAQTTPCVNCLSLNLPTGSIQAAANGTLNTSTDPSSSGDGYFSVPITGSTGSLPNGTYAGWCATNENDNVVGSAFSYTPGSTYLPALNTTVWNEVNWILNNKQAAGPSSVLDVQKAIWIVINGSTGSPSPTASALASAAQSLAAQTFIPAPGQVMGVLLTISLPGYQNLLVEVKNPCGAIGDFVWNDLNNNGIQDAGEPGINGVTVTLTDTAKDSLTTVTGLSPAGYSYMPAGTSGYYQFAGLCAGSYTVTIDNTQSGLTGYAPTITLAGNGQNPTTDSNPNPAFVTLPTTAGSMADETIDFGYYAPAPPTSGCLAIEAVQGLAMTPVTMTAGGGAGGPYTFTAVGLPAGLSISLTGTISGTPTVNGTFTYTVTIKDAAGITGTSICSITVYLPVTTVCAAINAVQGVAMTSATLTAGGGTGGPYTFTAVGLPAGLSISSNGTISGIPTVNGAFSYTVTVTDKDGHTGTMNCSFTVDPPVTANCAVIIAVQGVAITPAVLTGAGGMGGPYTFTATGLPTGLNMAANGTISGTPTVTGTFYYTVTTTDSANNTGTSTCSVTVYPPITSTCAVINAAAGTPITPVTMTASGGTGTGYIFSATGLPNGLSISTGGTISGTPLQSGTFPYTVTITDSAGITGTLNCSLVVSSSMVTPPLGLTCPSNLGELGAAYSSAVVASGGVAPYSYSIASGALPTGLSLNKSTGAITGTLTVGGSFNFSIMVKDSLGHTAISSCSCTPSSSTWNFASPTGNQGNNQPYTVNGITITAYGFTNYGWPTALYGNNSGSDQYGLGIDATSTNEIDSSNFVQLDLTSVIASGAQNATMTVTNVQSGESFNVYGSNTLGSIGTVLLSNQTTDGTPFAIPNFGNYKYISVRAAVGNVLLGAVSFTLGNCTIAVTIPVDIECGTCGNSGKAKVGTPYTATLAATGGSGKYTYSIVTGSGFGPLPPGLTLTASTGVISGTPTAAGTYVFTSKVTDSAGNTDTVTCTITVVAIPLDLECGACAQGKATVGTAYSASLSAIGGTAPFKYTIIKGTLPAGLSLNATSGAITGTPTTPGNYTITAQVVDANGSTDTSTCTIVVVGSPVKLDCGPCSAGKAYVGQGYSVTMAVSGAKAPYTFSISGSLPPGLSLNAGTGVISGTPTKAGTYTFTATVVDAYGNSGTDNCTIVVVGAPPVNLDCGACGSGASNGKVGSSYTATLSVSGGKSPFKFSIASGSLPTGLPLSASGAIAGTPTAAGTYTFTAMVTDANGSTDTATCTIVITGSSINLGCGSCGSGKATVGAPYSSTPTVSGGTAPFTYSIVSGSLPPGLKLNATTGAISGTPTAAGAYTFTTGVVDSRKNTDTQVCTIVVVGSPINLNCGTCGTNSYTSVGASYSAALTVSGGSAPFTYSLVSGTLPPGLKLTPGTGVISGTPITAGTYTFTTGVVDSKKNTDTQICTIVVAPSALNLICGTCGNGKATVGTFYSATMTVTGGTGPFTYSIISSSLPPGLTLDSSKGVVSGTPTTAATYVFTTKVVDSKGKTDTATCTVVVVGSSINLDCGPCSAGKATAGTAYTAIMKATGGTGPYTYSIASGSSLPAGLTLNTSTGVISGTPTTAGTYTFTAKVVDSKGNSDTDTCTIVVIAPVNLNASPCAASKATAGSGYSATMAVTGGKGPYTFSIVSGSLPQGVSLNGSTGQVSGTPASAGNYTFTSKVVDGNGNWDTDTCTIVVQQSSGWNWGW